MILLQIIQITWEIWVVACIITALLFLVVLLYLGWWKSRKKTPQSTGREKIIENSQEEVSLRLRDESGFRHVMNEESVAVPLETSSASAITIRKQNIYVPEQLGEPMAFSKNEIVYSAVSDYHLIFMQNAFQKLQKSLDWNQQTKRNVIEQGGVLIGLAYQYGEQVYCVADDIVLASTKGSSAFVEFTPDCWMEMQQTLDELNKERSQKGVIIGWFHTHPNSLPVFMSGTDLETQQKNFHEEWQVSLVLNPHTQIFKSFFGYRATIGSIIIRKEEK